MDLVWLVESRKEKEKEEVEETNDRQIDCWCKFTKQHLLLSVSITI